MKYLILLLLLFCGCNQEVDLSGCDGHHGEMLNNMAPGEFNLHMKRVHGVEFGRNHKKCNIDHLSLYKLNNGTLEDHLEHCLLFEENEQRNGKLPPTPFPKKPKKHRVIY